MTLHAPTLVAATIIVCFTASVMLALSWLQNQKERCLYIWACATLLGTLSAILFLLRGVLPELASVHAANVAMFVSAGLGWSGTRAFAGKKTGWLAISVAPALWTAVFAFSPVMSVEQNLFARNFMSAAVTSAFALATALEFWKLRGERLVSVIPSACLLAIHGLLHGLRIPASLVAEVPSNGNPLNSSFASMVALEILGYAVAITFLRIALVRERAEMTSRKAVATDLLTGAASRREFFAHGETVLQRAAPRRIDCVVLIADLDHFKAINDRWGHAAGDAVLQEFTARAVTALGARARFARLGGEEFAAVISDITAEDAFALATNMLDSIAMRTFVMEQAEIAVTVSIGLAFTSRSGYDLETLLRHADTALYCAKHNGRNRIECADIVGHSAPRIAA